MGVILKHSGKLMEHVGPLLAGNDDPQDVYLPSGLCSQILRRYFLFQDAIDTLQRCTHKGDKLPCDLEKAGAVVCSAWHILVCHMEADVAGWYTGQVLIELTQSAGSRSAASKGETEPKFSRLKQFVKKFSLFKNQRPI